MQICTGRYWCCGYEHHSKEKVWNCEETTNIHISFFLSSASVQNLSDTVEKESHLKKTNSGLNHKINTSSLTCFQKLCPGWKLNQRAFLEKQRQVLVWPISSALPPPLPFLFFFASVHLPPPRHSTVRRANSNEHVGTLTRKDSGDKGNRTRAGSTGSNSSGKRSDR